MALITNSRIIEPGRHGLEGSTTSVPGGLMAWHKDGGEYDSARGFHGTLQQSLPAPGDYTGPWFGTRPATLYAATTGYVSLPTGVQGMYTYNLTFPYPNGNHARTFTMWVKPNGTLDGGDYLFGIGAASANQTWNARCGGNKMGFMGYGAGDHDNDGDVVYSTGNWVRIWYTYGGPNDRYLRTYYTTNGTITTNWTWNWTAANTGQTTASIGAHAASPGSYRDTDATIRDFRIYDRALSTAEMAMMWLE